MGSIDTAILNALEVNMGHQPGERVAILGRIGSGKTTLEKLILGLYRPSEGAVLIDGIDHRRVGADIDVVRGGCSGRTGGAVGCHDDGGAVGEVGPAIGDLDSGDRVVGRRLGEPC